MSTPIGVASDQGNGTYGTINEGFQRLIGTTNGVGTPNKGVKYAVGLSGGGVATYWLLEDMSGFFQLEDGTGNWLLEEA